MAVAACTEAERFQEVVLQEKMWMFSELKQPNRVQLNIFTIPEDRDASKMVFFAFPPKVGNIFRNNGGQRSENLWQELSTWHGVELETDLTVWGSQVPLQ